MFGFTIASTILSGILAGIQLYKSYKQDKNQTKIAQDNLALNNKVSEQNFDLAKEQFEYQKDLNETVMNREDTAMQRQIADLKAAGMSPLMASGGASATPLTSANAPQMDLSGVNQAMGNMLSAYNDVFNRKLNRAQFALQSAVQASQAYTQLAESRLQRRYLGLQADYLDSELKYNKVHGFRDLNWRSELARLAESILGFNGSSVTPSTLNNLGLPNLDGVAAALGAPANPAQLFNRSPDYYKLPVTNNDIKRDQKKIVSAEKTHYQNATDTLYNFQNKDWEQSALSYFYRHTDAWRDYEHLDDFRKALLNEKNKGKFLSKYPYIERKALNLGS